MIRPAIGTRARGEDGAILVQAAAAVLMLAVLSGFVVNYGVQLVSRNEAQNAADAAALAAASALAFDDWSDRSQAGAAYLAATNVASTNVVAGEPPSLAVDANFVCELSPEEVLIIGAAPPRACVEVRASRDTDHGNAIPAFFASLMGVNDFGISARAIARAQAVNATRCLRPIAVPDRWTELTPPWEPASVFDWRDAAGALLPPAAQDTYAPPVVSESGSGLTLADRGLHVTLTEGQITTPQATIKPWQYLPLEIPDSQWGGGAAALQNNTNSCAAGRVTLDDFVNLVPGDVHANALSIAAGLNELIASDPAATWNAAARRVENSCAQAAAPCAPMSPRIIAIALYSPERLSDDSAAGVPASVWVKNIAGFFVESVTGTDITGYVTTHPGLRNADSFTLFDDSSFLRAAMLVK